MPNVEEYLKSKNINYVLHEHPAVFTCEDVEKLCLSVPGLASKNLFLRDQKKLRFFLLILPATKQTDLKKFAEIVAEKKLSFANSDLLMEKLGVEPGSVSPFGLLNDTEHKVEVYIDSEIYNAEIVNFHPNRNMASLELTKEMFHKYLQSIENSYKIIKI